MPLAFTQEDFLVADGIFSEVELSVADYVDYLRITSGNEAPEVSLEGVCAITEQQADTSLDLAGAVSRDLSHDLEPQDKLVVPGPKQMKNINVSFHGSRCFHFKFY